MPQSARLILCAMVVAGIVSCQTGRNDVEEPQLTPQEAEIARLREATVTSPNDAATWYALGNALFDANLLIDARDAYRSAAELDPDDARAFTNLGLTLRRMGDFPGAIAAYDRAMALEPDNATLLANVYAIHQMTGNADAAFDVIERLHNLNSDDLEIMLRYADGLYERERYSAAATLYARLTAAVPQLDRAHFRNGMCLYRLNARDRAMEIWEAGLRVNPSNVAILQAMPVFYMEEGDWEKAWGAVRRCQAEGIAIEAAVIERLQTESGMVGPP